MKPAYYASKMGDQAVTVKIALLRDRQHTAVQFFHKNMLRYRARTNFLRLRKHVITIQRMGRGLLDRIMCKLVRSGHIALPDGGDDGTESVSRYGGINDYDDESVGSSIRSNLVSAASSPGKKSKKGRKMLKK
jgi:hypothetical protein